MPISSPAAAGASPCKLLGTDAFPLGQRDGTPIADNLRLSIIYVASSWRNPYYSEVVKRLKAEGHDVYGFRNPPHDGSGFHWTDVDENAPNWTFEEYAPAPSAGRTAV